MKSTFNYLNVHAVLILAVCVVYGWYSGEVGEGVVAWVGSILFLYWFGLMRTPQFPKKSMKHAWKRILLPAGIWIYAAMLLGIFTDNTFLFYGGIVMFAIYAVVIGLYSRRTQPPEN